jgi:hypothetical protein
MKYFTPELYVRLQEFDTDAMDRVDAEWEAAQERYEERLRELGAVLQPFAQRLENVLLHDATVRTITRGQDRLTIELLTDRSPKEVVTLTYSLAGEPFINRNALPEQHRGGMMQYQYDELDVLETVGPACLTHSILFSNGWEMRVPFRDLHVAVAEAIYPVQFPETGSAAPAGVPRTA